jgi:hypothetical protein
MLRESGDHLTDMRITFSPPKRMMEDSPGQERHLHRRDVPTTTPVYAASINRNGGPAFLNG